MGILVALAAGYVIGARAGSKDLDQVARSLRSLLESEEFADVMIALRSHLGHTLRELANAVDGNDGRTGDSGDLVERVTHIFGNK